MIRVVIADDQALMRAGFRMIFEAEPDIELVGEASDGAEAVRVARATSPDVVIMDVRMPGMNGIEATRALTARRLGGPGDHADDLRHGRVRLRRAAGRRQRLPAEGRPPEQLILGIHAACRGESLLSPAITRRMIETFIAQPRASVAAPDAGSGC